MFAQFFGAYLLNKKLVTPEELTQAFEDKNKTRMRLGVLAINAGLMTAEQVEYVNVAQQSVDKRFGDLAVELGYITKDQVEELLAQQPTEYLLLGQTLVNNGALSNSDFEAAINDYKASNQFSDEDLVENTSESISKLVSVFYHLEKAENARVLTNYVSMLFKNIVRFVGSDFTPLTSSAVRDFSANYLVTQKITGGVNGITCIAADSAQYLEFAKRFAGESFTEVDDFVNETVGEFLNIQNGLFAVNESNENGLELTMTPQTRSSDGKIVFEKAAFSIPVAFSFGEIVFIISIE